MFIYPIELLSRNQKTTEQSNDRDKENHTKYLYRFTLIQELHPVLSEHFEISLNT